LKIELYHEGETRDRLQWRRDIRQAELGDGQRVARKVSSAKVPHETAAAIEQRVEATTRVHVFVMLTHVVGEVANLLGQRSN
jgi:hypothetical protein